MSDEVDDCECGHSLDEYHTDTGCVLYRCTCRISRPPEFVLQVQDEPRPEPSRFESLEGVQGALEVDVPVVTKLRDGQRAEQPTLGE